MSVPPALFTSSHSHFLQMWDRNPSPTLSSSPDSQEAKWQSELSL